MRCPLLSPRTILPVGTFLLVVASGCQTLNSELPAFLGGEPAVQSQPVAENPNAPKYFVEFREDGQKPALVPFPLNEPTLVQQVLDQSGAFKKFRRAKVEIFRQLPGGGGHRLAVDYDRSKRQVASECDYAIHPNDRVVVTEDTSTVLDDMLESLGAKPGK